MAEGEDWGDSMVVEDGLVEVSWGPWVLGVRWWVGFVFEDGDDGVADGGGEGEGWHGGG